GPLVRPGVSACLRCLDLHRSDRDPDWPALAAQLSTDSGDLVACDAGLALMVAAQTVREALTLLDGGVAPASVGGTLELAPGDWRWRRRSWQVHPDCPCGWEQPPP
ncbi:MAG: cyclodehydratase, partial [Mycobacteriales bacterium]